jgi:polyisoprenoid-binding protein YceI
MKRLFVTAAFAALMAIAPYGARGETIAPVKTDIPSGEYLLDKSHGSLLFRVDHIGLTHFTARFSRFDAKLQLDPADPARSSLTATIDTNSVDTGNGDPTFDFDALIRGETLLDAARYPEMTFTSTEIAMTSPSTARVTGDFTMHGVTAPVTLDVSFNAGYGGGSVDPSGSRIGFSAHGTLKRSAFGIALGIPEPGSTIGVGDDVEILIEVEFLQKLPPAQ